MGAFLRLLERNEKAPRGQAREEHSSPPIGQRQPYAAILRPDWYGVNVPRGLAGTDMVEFGSGVEVGDWRLVLSESPP